MKKGQWICDKRGDIAKILDIDHESNEIVVEQHFFPKEHRASLTEWFARMCREDANVIYGKKREILVIAEMRRYEIENKRKEANDSTSTELPF